MLELKHVSKIYKEEKSESVNALIDINLSFPNTGLVVISGASGCGKTTLLNILGGLDRPTTGEVKLNNNRIDNQNEEWWDSFRALYLGFIYQDFNLLENMSVRENIQLPLDIRMLDDKTKQEMTENIIDELGLNSYIDKKVKKLSAGQRQRVAMARALVTGAKIILADEPTGNLDQHNSENVFKLLKKIAQNHLVIVVTHDTTLASMYADRLIQIQYGNIEKDEILTESPKDSRSNEFLIKKSEKKLPITECLKFTYEGMKLKKLRCFISLIIFSITLLFIIVLCEFIIRNDSKPLTEYLNDTNQKVIPLFTDVSDKYTNVVGNEKITSGKKFYNLLCSCMDKDKIIRYGGSFDINVDNKENINCQKIYVTAEAEKYFTYKGLFPKKENEIAISKQIADQFSDTQNILGSNLHINKKTYTITAIVSQVCEKNISDMYVNNETGDNIFSNLVLLPTEALTDKNLDSSLYMAGFGVTNYSNLFYQTTIYNEIRPVYNGMNLVAGRMPERDNEILVSQSLLESRNQTNDILNIKYKQNDLYDSKYGVSFWNMINLYDYMGENISIVGVVDEAGEYFITTSLYNTLFEEYKTYFEPTYYMIADEKTLMNDISNISDNDIKIIDDELTKVYELIENIDYFKVFLFLFLLIIIILFIFQMISQFSYSINDNKKTIGILRTIGVTKADTKKFFIIECLIISFFSFLVAIIASIIITNVINNFVNQNILEIYNYNFLRTRLILVIIIGIINCVLSISSVIIPIKKYSKAKIVDLIK